jgi:hypothetical protein
MARLVVAGSVATVWLFHLSVKNTPPTINTNNAARRIIKR